ncbi:MAG: polysaccharide biosynthesis/export family protein, partial [Silvibacterium sp.]
MNTTAPALDAMRQQLVFSLSVFFAVFSPLAIAQNPPTGEYPSNVQTNPSVDCSDPLLANSSECQTSSQIDNSGNSAQQYGQPGVNPQQNPASIPQPGMNRPQTYSDIGNQNNQQNQNNNILNNQRPLPPQPLTEFQKFVAGTTGEVLPIFGASLFKNAPSTFAPMDEAPVPPDYVIGPGDELRIRIWGQVN